MPTLPAVNSAGDVTPLIDHSHDAELDDSLPDARTARDCDFLHTDRVTRIAAMPLMSKRTCMRASHMSASSVSRLDETIDNRFYRL